MDTTNEVRQAAGAQGRVFSKRMLPIAAGLALALASTTAYAQSTASVDCGPQKAAEGGSNPLPQKAAEGGSNPLPQKAAEGGSNPLPQKAAEGGSNPLPQK